MWRQLAILFVTLSVIVATTSVCAQDHSGKKTAVVRFFAPVNEATVSRLLQVVDDQTRMGAQRVVILISSPGGSVFAGISAYNYLKGAPIEIVTHNFGSVDSIAVLLYCAGSIRYSVPEAEFLLHPIAAQIASGITLDQPAIEEQLKLMENQTKSIASIIATTTGEKVSVVQNTIQQRTTLDATEAQKWGLVQGIRPELIPKDAQVISIQTAASNPSANLAPATAPPQSGVSALGILSLRSFPRNTGFSSGFDQMQPYNFNSSP